MPCALQSCIPDCPYRGELLEHMVVPFWLLHPYLMHLETEADSRLGVSLVLELGCGRLGMHLSLGTLMDSQRHIQIAIQI